MDQQRRTPRNKAPSAAEAAAEWGFNPAKNLKEAILGRKTERGFSIDPRGTYIIDDGLFIRRHDRDGWQIRVSIADLPAIIPWSNRLERQARAKMREVKENGEVRRIFPAELLENFASLRLGKIRPTITGTFYLDKEFNVQQIKVKRTAFENQREFDIGSFDQYKDTSPEQDEMWRALSKGLYERRVRDMAHRFDRVLYNDATPSNSTQILQEDHGGEGRALVHEIMRMANRALTDFCREKDIVVPIVHQDFAVRVGHVTDDFEFDLMCNRVCVNSAQKISMVADPYAHFNSPMREYRDYLAVRILGNYVRDGQVHPDLRREAVELNQKDNDKVVMRLRPLTTEKWSHKWFDTGSMQATLSRFEMPDIKDHYPVIALRKHFSDAAQPLPQLAERVIQIGGLKLNFAAIQMKTAQGAPITAAAIGFNPADTVSRATDRLLRQLPS
jgi:exoribonuclease R